MMSWFASSTVSVLLKLKSALRFFLVLVDLGEFDSSGEVAGFMLFLLSNLMLLEPS